MRRYKRFLADVLLDSGEALTAHCPNTGAMTGCAEPGSTVWLSKSDNPKRKYAYTWELVETVHGVACVHTTRANYVVGEALERGHIGVLAGAGEVHSEVQAPQSAVAASSSEADTASAARTRFDFALGDKQSPAVYVEVKSVTLCESDGGGLFPDAVSARAVKHLEALVNVHQAGHRAVLLFCAQHTGIERVAPAEKIHPAYAQKLAWANQNGVEVLAYGCRVTPEEVSLAEELVVSIDADSLR